jgi:acyl carrier protein
VGEISDKVATFVSEELVLDASTIDADSPLLEHLDSLALLQLVAFVEEEFEVEIPDADVNRGNFETPRSIEALVAARTEE